MRMSENQVAGNLAADVPAGSLTLTLSSSSTTLYTHAVTMADKPPQSGLCVVFARVVAHEGKADQLEALITEAIKSARSDKEPYTLTYRCARNEGQSELFSLSWTRCGPRRGDLGSPGSSLPAVSRTHSLARLKRMLTCSLRYRICALSQTSSVSLRSTSHLGASRLPDPPTQMVLGPPGSAPVLTPPPHRTPSDMTRTTRAASSRTVRPPAPPPHLGPAR